GAVVLKKIEGAIEIGATSWQDGVASVTLRTTASGYTIQYKINEESWTNLAEAPGTSGNTGTNGIVTGLKHNDTIHVRLTNGAQVGDETSTQIKDETAPQVNVTAPNKDTSTIGVNVVAQDNESGMTESLTYTYYIKEHSAGSYGTAKVSN